MMTNNTDRRTVACCEEIGRWNLADSDADQNAGEFEAEDVLDASGKASIAVLSCCICAASSAEARAQT